jgi:GNAT superfamily N-acetyltransferase
MSTAVAVMLEYRAATPNDQVLWDAFADARGAEFELLPEPVRTQLLDLQFTAQQHHHQAAYPFADDRIILFKGHAAGRVLVNRGPVETVLVDIAILRAYRGGGLGSAVLAELCREADSHGRPIRLRALATKPGLARWYGRFGFTQAEASGAHLVFVRVPQAEGDTA